MIQEFTSPGPGGPRLSSRGRPQAGNQRVDALTQERVVLQISTECLGMYHSRTGKSPSVNIFRENHLENLRNVGRWCV